MQCNTELSVLVGVMPVTGVSCHPRYHVEGLFSERERGCGQIFCVEIADGQGTRGTSPENLNSVCDSCH